MAPNGWNSGMPLNILCRTTPTTKNYLAKYVNGVEVEKSVLEGASDKASLPFSNIYYFSRLGCFSAYNSCLQRKNQALTCFQVGLGERREHYLSARHYIMCCIYVISFNPPSDP